jgi:hypothetical protein
MSLSLLFCTIPLWKALGEIKCVEKGINCVTRNVTNCMPLGLLESLTYGSYDGLGM